MPKQPHKSTYSRLQIKKKLKDLEFKKDMADAAKDKAETNKLTIQLNFFRKLLQVKPELKKLEKDYKNQIRRKNST